MRLVDFAIVTGLTEEFDILKRIIPDLKEPADESNGWYRTRVTSVDGTRTYSLVAAFQNGMGPLEANSLTASIIKRWNPAYIILVGIAGSFQGEVRLGDVIVSQQIFYYDIGKEASKGISYRPQGYPCSTVLIRQAEALNLDKLILKTWQKAAKKSAIRLASKLVTPNRRLSKHAQSELKNHLPAVHFGTVASGSLVIANRRKRQKLLALHGKILGTEMEGAGVLHAAFYEEIPTPAIVIKGISDAADKNKDREDAKLYWRELAKENSARFALDLIRRGRINALQTDEFNLDPTNCSPGDVRAVITIPAAPPVTYLGFPRLIIPLGPLTEVRIHLGAQSVQGSVKPIVLVITYVNRNGVPQSRKLENLENVHLSEPMDPDPIGVYALFPGQLSVVDVSVTTSVETKQASWKPPL